MVFTVNGGGCKRRECQKDSEVSDWTSMVSFTEIPILGEVGINIPGLD